MVRSMVRSGRPLRDLCPLCLAKELKKMQTLELKKPNCPLKRGSNTS
jgi:hypothetical protein